MPIHDNPETLTTPLIATDPIEYQTAEEASDHAEINRSGP